jgi:hypothetical protein
MSFHPCAVKVESGVGKNTDALLIKISTRPAIAQASRLSRRISASWERSADNTMAFRPNAATS